VCACVWIIDWQTIRQSLSLCHDARLMCAAQYTCCLLLGHSCVVCRVGWLVLLVLVLALGLQAGRPTGRKPQKDETRIHTHTDTRTHTFAQRSEIKDFSRVSQVDM